MKTLNRAWLTLCAVALACSAGVVHAQSEWRVVERPFGPGGGLMAVSPRDNVSGAQLRYYCMPSSAGNVERLAVHNPNIDRLETNRQYNVNFAFPDTGDQMLTLPMLARPITESIESDGPIDRILEVMKMQPAMAVTQQTTVQGYPVSLHGFAAVKARVRASCGLR